MLNTRSSRFGWLVALGLGSWPVAAQATEHRPRYHYVSLDQAELPAGFTRFSLPTFFGPTLSAINDSDQIAGTAFDDAGAAHVAVYRHGVVAVLQPLDVSFGRVINEDGTIGGLFVDPVTGHRSGALFRGQHVEVIPGQPGESESLVTALNDAGTAVLVSLGPSGATWLLYEHGQTTPIDFGPTISPQPDPGLYLNNRDVIAGTTAPSDPFDGARGFTLEPRTGEVTLLDPLPSDTLAWAQGINDRGHVLGYSFVDGGEENVGVWGRDGKFSTYFTEGNAQFPTISNQLLFNEQELIVITRTNDNTSYLVPARGERLNLADLTDDLPPLANPLFWVSGMNNRGNLTG